MGKYNALAHIILTNVGGKSNIKSVTHCITRLRFVLKDESKAHKDVLEATDGVSAVIQSGGQYQIVIGTHVGDVYDDVVSVGRLHGIVAGEADDKDDAAVEGRGIFSAFVGIVTSVFTPMIGMLCAAGMMKGLSAAAVSLGLLAKTDAAYLFWYNAGDALFYFLPVIIGWTAARKFKLSEITGIMIGLVFCAPALTSLGSLDTIGQVFGLDYKLSFFGIPVILPANNSYAQTVIPVIVTVWAASKVEGFFKRVLPAMVKSFLVPFFTLLITIPVAFVVIGPITSGISNILASFTLSVYSIAPWLAGGMLGLIHQTLVIFGLHWAYSPIRYNNFATLGYDTFITPNFPAAWTQGAAAMAVYFKTKDKKAKGLCLSSFLSTIFGVSEPAIYSVNLPRKVPFACASVAAGVAGALVGAMQIKIYSGGVGIFALANFIDPNTGDMSGVLSMAACILVGMVISFALTLLFYREKDVEREFGGAMNCDVPADQGADVSDSAALSIEEPMRSAGEVVVIESPVSGDVVALSEVPDAAFASGALGRGFAVRPREGKVVAPFSGIANVVFPTGHALGLVDENGVELLIHVGIDTVSLDGKPFSLKVSQGDRIKAGQVLLDFDIAQIEAAGCSSIVPVVVSNFANFTSVEVVGNALEVTL